jgi:hypothetical protein
VLNSTLIAAIAVAGAVQTTQPVIDARQVKLGAPQSIVELDTDKLKGQLAGLGWSPDGREMYLQTVERDRQGAVKSAKHYVITLESKALKNVGDQPAWASQYWAWKSGQASPGSPAFKFAIEERQETKRATAAVGDLAKGGGGGGDGRGGIPGTSADEAGAISNQSQVVHIWTLKLKGTTIGEWLNEGVTPGTNFGWAPAPSKLIAFTKREGGSLMLLDDQGRKQELTGAKVAVLPAWSADGRKLAWLEKKDRKKFELTIADVSMQ